MLSVVELNVVAPKSPVIRRQIILNDFHFQIMVDWCRDGTSGRHPGRHRSLQAGHQPQEDEPGCRRLQRRSGSALIFNELAFQS